MQQFELPSPTSLDPSGQCGLTIPPTGEKLIPPMPKRSDPNRWSIANTTQPQHSGGAFDRPTDSVLFNPAFNGTNQIRRPSFAHGLDSRSSFGQGQLIPMTSSRQPSVSIQTGSPPSFWTSEMPIMSTDNHSFIPGGLTSGAGDYSSFLEPPYFPGILPITRQLPQPAGGGGSGIRFSCSSCYSHPRGDENLSYSSDNCDVERVMSETRPGSIASTSFGPTSTDSSSPKDSRDSSNYGYPSISHSPPEIAGQQLNEYSSTVAATTMDPISTFSKTASDQDQRRRSSLPNSHYDYYSHQSIDQRMNRQTSDSSGAERTLPRHIQPQPRCQVPLRPLTSGKT